MTACKIPIDSVRLVMRPIDRSNPDRDEYETNQLFRFRTVLSGHVPLLRACEVPVRAGNRSLPRLTAFGGFFFTLNRKAPAGNAPAPHRRISKRASKHGRMDNQPTCSKSLPAPHGNSKRRQSVYRAYVMAEASDWSRCADRYKNAKRLVPSCDEIQRDRELLAGVSVCS